MKIKNFECINKLEETSVFSVSTSESIVIEFSIKYSNVVGKTRTNKIISQYNRWVDHNTSFHGKNTFNHCPEPDIDDKAPIYYIVISTRTDYYGVRSYEIILAYNENLKVWTYWIFPPEVPFQNFKEGILVKVEMKTPKNFLHEMTKEVGWMVIDSMKTKLF